MASPFEYKALTVDKLAQTALDILEDEDDSARAQVFATLAHAKAIEESHRS